MEDTKAKETAETEPREELRCEEMRKPEKPEYHEGTQAGENFRKLARALFQVKKDGRQPNSKRQPKKATSRKSRGSGKD